MADYYELLGVSRDVDADSLKRAYRRLARQYHPDINKEAGAEDKFKEIGRAYEVLSDPQTRARYDQFGEAGIGGGAGMPDMGDMGGFADLFETFFSGFGGGGGGQAGPRRRGPRQGDDLRLDLTISFQEAVFGVEKEVQIPRRAADPPPAAPAAAPARCAGPPAPRSAASPSWRCVPPARAPAR